MRKLPVRALMIVFGFAVVVLAGWAGYALAGVEDVWSVARLSEPPGVPTTAVLRGDVNFTVTAKGELQGGNTETLTAPMIGAQEMAITFLRQPGEVVKKGEVVVQFDTTEQEFNLREAEADLAEAEQKVIQARAESLAKAEEAARALIEARGEAQTAELEIRKNELLSKIAARQNILALEAARDRLRQLEKDLADRQATAQAGIKIQEASLEKAKVKAQTARKNIDSMTLRAGSDGYVAIEQNTQSNIRFRGMDMPMLQVGDRVRPGMPVARIPDLANWQATAEFAELDRGHLAPGQTAAVTVVAVPGESYLGKVKYVGGTTGPPWWRRFDCRVTIDRPSPRLRPGMSARITVTTEVLRNVLKIPAPALFSRGERNFVYLKTPSGFVPTDVEIVRRSESQVVITGLQENQEVALAAPEQAQESGRARGPLEALQ